MTKRSGSKTFKIIAIIIILCLATAAGATFYYSTQEGGGRGFNHVDFPEPIYSTLSGEEIDDASENLSPTFCVQIPNGSTDGARPQAGLAAAKVVFEAIAEAGITRFAAIFQNPTVGVIGPIRSLRPYYLDWDTPFDCTVVHDGGSTEALAAIATGGQRNLDENFDYMWKVSDSSRLWNNVFTSPELLLKFNQSHNYDTSNPVAFARLTPSEATERSEQVVKGCESDSSDDSICDTLERAGYISIRFTASSSHNAVFEYDSGSNTYLRSHQDGNKHYTLSCAESLDNCTEVQVAPNVVVAMYVKESTMSDNYHEQIQTTGTGKAVVFQNGEVISATWAKKSQKDQIIFKDENGEVIKLNPGQLWISAVPQYGEVTWQ